MARPQATTTSRPEIWWAVRDSNPRRSVCRTDALAAELTARNWSRPRESNTLSPPYRGGASPSSWSGMIGTRCGSRTRLYCVKNSGLTDRRTGLALPTRIELVLTDRQSAVQTTTLREHGGRCRYRSPAGLSRVHGSFQNCLPGHERHLPEKAHGRIRTDYIRFTKAALILMSHTGIGVHGPTRTGE
jgi:hypothetical protein